MFLGIILSENPIDIIQKDAFFEKVVSPPDRKILNLFRYLRTYDMKRYLPEIDLDEPIPSKLLQEMEVQQGDFKEALKKSYDIFVAFNCLSEPPPSYYKEIFETVKTKGIFILDGDINDNEFQKHLDRFSQKMKARVIQGRLAPCKGIHPNSKKVIEGLYNTLPNKEGKLIPIGGRVSLHTRNI